MAKKTEQREQTTVMLGWAAEPLHKQLKVPKKDLEALQADANAILRLRVRGYLNDGARDRAYKRLLAAIPKTIGDAQRQRREKRDAARTT